MPGIFYEVERADFPNKFSGFFEPVGDAGLLARGLQLSTAAWSSTSFAWNDVNLTMLPGRKYNYDTFYIEAYWVLVTHKPSNTLIGPNTHPASCVRSEYIEAENYFASGANGNNPTRHSRDRVNCLLRHETGHYRITRLIALDLFRSLVFQATKGTPFPNQDAARSKYNETLEEYRFIKELVQCVYELATNFGRDEGQQSRWDKILDTAESEAGDWKTSKNRLGPSFWPGLEYILANQPTGSQFEADLAKNLLGAYASTPNINKSAAQVFSNQLQALVQAAKTQSHAAAAP